MFLAAAQTLKLEEALKMLNNHKTIAKLAEGVGFEPTVALRLLLISSQVPLTTQPPFHYVDFVM